MENTESDIMKEQKAIIKYVKGQIKKHDSALYNSLNNIYNLQTTNPEDIRNQFKNVFSKELKKATEVLNLSKDSIPKTIDELYICFLYSKNNFFTEYPHINTMNKFKKILLNDPMFKEMIFDAIKKTPDMSIDSLAKSVQDALKNYCKNVGLYYSSKIRDNIYGLIKKDIPKITSSYTNHIIKKQLIEPNNIVELLDYLKTNNLNDYNDFKSNIYDIHRQKRSLITRKKVQYAEEIKDLLNKTLSSVEFSVIHIYLILENDILNKLNQVSREKATEVYANRTNRKSLEDINKDYFIIDSGSTNEEYEKRKKKKNNLRVDFEI